MQRSLVLIGLAFLLAGLGACGDDADSSGTSSAAAASEASQIAQFEEKFVVEVVPGEPIAATDVREYGVDDAEVITTGRIDKFVDGFAVMTIVDLAVPY